MPYNVLAVDDSATVRAVIAKTLRLSGVAVSRFGEAARGDDALRMLREEKFDLVFCDLNMPGMTGYELVEALRKDGLMGRVAVVIISSFGNPGVIEELKSKGVKGYLRKPLRPESLKRVVTRVMEQGVDAAQVAAATRVFLQVLSESAFLFGEPVTPEELPQLEGAALLASVPFGGGSVGKLALAVPERLAEEIAANTLGVTPADPEVRLKTEDSVRELASIMGGHLAGAADEPDGALTFAPPRITRLERPDWDLLRRDPAARCFTVNDQPVLFRAVLESGDAAR